MMGAGPLRWGTHDWIYITVEDLEERFTAVQKEKRCLVLEHSLTLPLPN